VIPGATISLSRPHPRATRAPIREQPTETSQYAQLPKQATPTPPAALQPQDQNWVVARSDQTGRAVLQFDDREAPPGTLVDVILYYPNGALRRLADVPIETILAGGVLEITGTDIPPGGYNAPPPQPQSGILPGILPNIGIGIGVGGHRSDRDHSRDP
jgi:hypothetical protein